MKQIVPRVATAALLLASILPARAEVTPSVHDIQTKIDTAMKSAKSFSVRTLYPAQEYSSTLVYIAPDRSRISVAIAANTTDIVTIGSTTYSSKNGAPFEKGTVSADQGAELKTIATVKVGTVHPDVTLDGVAYGAFDTTVPFGDPQTLTCAYDKKTFRLVRCANDDVTRTYTGYDDPENVVETPKNIAAAPKDAK